jgi:hypothetical protein
MGRPFPGWLSPTANPTSSLQQVSRQIIPHMNPGIISPPTFFSTFQLDISRLKHKIRIDKKSGWKKI